MNSIVLIDVLAEIVSDVGAPLLVNVAVLSGTVGFELQLVPGRPAQNMCRLAQPKSDVHDLRFALDAKRQTTLLENFEHRDVIR